MIVITNINNLMCIKDFGALTIDTAVPVALKPTGFSSDEFPIKLKLFKFKYIYYSIFMQ